MKKQKARHALVASLVKLALCETPFHSTLAFRFEGDRLLLDSEHNIAFGPTKLPQLVGQAAREPARSR